MIKQNYDPIGIVINDNDHKIHVSQHADEILLIL